MKKMKKFAALLLALAMCPSLLSCSSTSAQERSTVRYVAQNGYTGTCGSGDPPVTALILYEGGDALMEVYGELVSSDWEQSGEIITVTGCTGTVLTGQIVFTEDGQEVFFQTSVSGGVIAAADENHMTILWMEGMEGAS